MKVCQPYLEQKDSSKTKQFLQGAWHRRGVSLYFGERGKRNKQEGTIIENRMKTEKGYVLYGWLHCRVPFFISASPFLG